MFAVSAGSIGMFSDGVSDTGAGSGAGVAAGVVVVLPPVVLGVVEPGVDFLQAGEAASRTMTAAQARARITRHPALIGAVAQAAMF